MKLNIDSMASTPVVNLWSPNDDPKDFARCSELTTKVNMRFGIMGHVQGHKDALGRQDFCYTGYRRYWIWNDKDLKWRVFVSNQGGVSFEVNSEKVASVSEATRCFEEYAKLIGAI